jgi:Nucleotide modification associated domain 3
MNALLVRVGADLSGGGGSWNGPVDCKTNDFVYVAIPESNPVQRGLEKPYAALAPMLQRFGVRLPAHLAGRHMHLDPDFTYLTYGDQGERAKQLRAHLGPGDLIVFYAGLADIRAVSGLVYAMIGLLVVDNLLLAADVPPPDRDVNAHSRRVLVKEAEDIIVTGRPAASGRLRRCIPIGEYRDRAYRVRRDLLDEWGGLSVKDGYLQRSARLPRFLDAERFLCWLETQEPFLIQSNN